MAQTLPSIVLVEDDASLSVAMERVLQAAGFHTSAFSSGEELLNHEAARDAACFLLDVHLPGMTGFELREALAEKAGDVPVIFMTAYDEPESRASARDSVFLVKPFAGRLLLDAIRHALEPRSKD